MKVREILADTRDNGEQKLMLDGIIMTILVKLGGGRLIRREKKGNREREVAI
jgi:hypothetical protein